MPCIKCVSTWKSARKRSVPEREIVWTVPVGTREIRGVAEKQKIPPSQNLNRQIAMVVRRCSKSETRNPKCARINNQPVRGVSSITNFQLFYLLIYLFNVCNRRAFRRVLLSRGAETYGKPNIQAFINTYTDVCIHLHTFISMYSSLTNTPVLFIYFSCFLKLK